MDSLSPPQLHNWISQNGLYFKTIIMDEKKEMVNHPQHYNAGSMECIDGLVGAFGKEEVAIFCKINAMKYIWRLGHKDDEIQEIGKIKWYLDKYIELTQPPIGLRLDTGEPVYESEIAICNEAPTVLYGKTDLLKKGLTERQIKDLLNK